MNKVVTLLVCLLISGFISIADDNDPSELTQARSTFQTKMKAATTPIIQKYLQQLDALKKQLGGKGDVEGAKRVQKEIEFIKSVDADKIGKAWTVVFSSNNPEKWNKEEVKKDAPEDMRYLRVKRMDTGDYVIIPLEKNKLTVDLEINSRYGWYGSGTFICNAYHLGIADLKKGIVNGTMVIDPYASPGRDHPGWGFGHKAWVANGGQYYGWDGDEIKKTVFEISVRTSELSSEEEDKLLK